MAKQNWQTFYKRYCKVKITIRETSFEVQAFEHLPFWQSIAKGEWEQDTFEVIDAFAKKHDIALDVGSWAGPITLYLASKVGRVHALEPDPAIYPQLEENVSLNPSLADKISTHSLALSSKSERVPLYARTEYGQSSSSLLNRAYDLKAEEHCDTVSLKDFVLREKIEKLDFIKMDIEGGEFIVLPTLEDVLKKLNYPSLLISFHYNHLRESILKEKIAFPLFSKLILKLDSWGLSTFFQKRTNQRIQESLSALSVYSYIYCSDGERKTLTELLRKPQQIKNRSFIFTNQQWKKSD